MSAKKPRIPVTCRACGEAFETTATKMAYGRGKYCSRSCGVRANGTRHGHTSKTTQSRTYTSWATMLQRCTNPRHPKFPMYGGAGIQVCEEWRSFDAFLADMGVRPPGTTIDRRDGRLGYCKSNCRWATAKEQQSHLSNHLMVSYEGAEIYLSELARRLGLNVATLRWRIAHWPKSRWADPPKATGRRQQALRDKVLARPPDASPTP